MIRLPLFPYRNTPHIRLTEQQKRIRAVIHGKITSGAYQLESVPCVCGSGLYNVIAENDRYGFPLKTVICQSCGLLRTEPRLAAAALNSFYATEYRDLYMGPEYGDMETYFANMVMRGNEILRVLRKACPELSLRGKRVLEIGCSAGGVLAPFIAEGCTVKGYDYDERYLNFGKAKNEQLNLLMGGVESLAHENEYDIIIMNHVLEHLHSPCETIRVVREHLANNGIFYVGVPGLMNPIYYFSPTRSFLGMLHIAHLYHFTQRSLQKICSEFELLHGDDEIHAVFQKSLNRRAQKTDTASSEYAQTLLFLDYYERSFQGRIKRFLMVIKTFPSLITLLFPENISNGIRSLHHIFRSLTRSRC